MTGLASDNPCPTISQFGVSTTHKPNVPCQRAVDIYKRHVPVKRYRSSSLLSYFLIYVNSFYNVTTGNKDDLVALAIWLQTVSACMASMVRSVT